jgi:hypothetical protein
VYKYEPVMYICALNRPLSNSHVLGRVDLHRDTSTNDDQDHNTVRRPLVNKKGVSEKPKGLAARGCEQ